MSHPRRSKSSSPIARRPIIVTLATTFVLGSLIEDQIRRHPSFGSPETKSEPSVQQPIARTHLTAQHTGLARTDHLVAARGSLADIADFSNADTIIAAAIRFDDPAAEKVISLLADAGWTKSEQARLFRETYSKLGSIYFNEELIAEDRLETRKMLSGVETNTDFSSDLKRQSRGQYEGLRALFEAHIRTLQQDSIASLMETLGEPPNIDKDELRRRLLEIHPHLPIDGPLLDLIKSP